MKYPIFTVVVLALASFTHAAPAALTKGGKALLPVVVAPDADPRVHAAAEELAAYLGRISGAQVAVETGSGQSGIAVGTAADFPDLTGLDLQLTGDLTDRETYLLRSHTNGVFVIGNTLMAVEHAVWDLLYEIGVRQFFPPAKWEVVPSHDTIHVDIDRLEKPDYVARRIWYGYGMWDYAKQPFDTWYRRNRMGGGFSLSTGHSYRGFISRNQAAFDEHPEYLALIDGERKGYKFCVSNPGLRKLVVEDALKQFEQRPDMDSISLDPSDGGGWCECETCNNTYASISDRALTLANAVAVAITKDNPDRRVGMYAYGFHSPPPTIDVHPAIVISCATSFLRGGFSLEQVMTGWAAKGATLGVREYYGVNVWDRDMPMRGRGGRIPYLTKTIPDFYQRGARYMTSESSDNWGPNGLGYYLSARMLWDVNEANRIDELTDDFLTRAFVGAKEPMRKFYKLIDGTRPSYVQSDLVGRMYGALKDARSQADSPEVLARIDDLVLYTRYVELYHAYNDASKAERQANYEALIRFAYRIRETEMIHVKGLYRDLDNRDKSIKLPKEAEWGVPEDKNPWKSSEPFTPDQIAGMVSEGIANNELVEMDFEPAEFSEELIPARGLQLPESSTGMWRQGRGLQTFYTWVDDEPGEIRMTITGGLIKHYRDRGNVKVDIYQIGGASDTGELETHVAHDESAPPDGEPRDLVFSVKQAGLYRVTVSDGGDLTAVAWEPGTIWTFKSTMDQPMKANGRWHLYFYVPKGTKKIGLYGGSTGKIYDPDGKVAFELEKKPNGFYGIPVGEGQDGKLWKIFNGSQAVRFLNVPPYLARNANELLLPQEVVERDMP